MTDDPRRVNAVGREANDTLTGVAVRLDECAAAISACALAIHQVVASMTPPDGNDPD